MKPASSECTRDRARHSACQEFHPVDVSHLTVQRDGYRATPIGFGCVADGRGPPDLNDQWKRFAIGTDAGKLTGGDGVGHAG